MNALDIIVVISFFFMIVFSFLQLFEHHPVFKSTCNCCFSESYSIKKRRCKMSSNASHQSSRSQRSSMSPKYSTTAPSSNERRSSSHRSHQRQRSKTPPSPSPDDVEDDFENEEPVTEDVRGRYETQPKRQQQSVQISIQQPQSVD